MAYVCPTCETVHPPGVLLCEDVAKAIEVRGREIEHHRQHCPGCPDPAQHMRNLEQPKCPHMLGVQVA